MFRDLGAAALILCLAGCGADDADAPPRTLSGDEVGRMAEAQLEAEHPGMAPGTISCPDLTLEVGATTRCTRQATLSQGRTVQVLGTVEVAGVEGAGLLHVQLDDEVTSFGLAAPELTRRVIARLDGTSLERPDLECPAIDGYVGAAVTCTDPREAEIPVVVTEVDPEAYTVEFEVGQLVG